LVPRVDQANLFVNGAGAMRRNRRQPSLETADTRGDLITW
jgi:hypothetical protein